jgi:hypothetical protein
MLSSPSPEMIPHPPTHNPGISLPTFAPHESFGLPIVPVIEILSFPLPVETPQALEFRLTVSAPEPEMNL